MKLCPHCETHELTSEREQYFDCCYVCRRYALLRGTWPEKEEVRNMSIQLTDEQIARVLTLTAKIAAIKQEMPRPPMHDDMVDLEIAKNLRASMERHNDELLELGALLR